MKMATCGALVTIDDARGLRKFVASDRSARCKAPTDLL